MTGTPDYRGIAYRIEEGALTPDDRTHVMALLRYETACHDGLATCRRPGDAEGRACPDLGSADDFALWVVRDHGGALCDIGMTDAGDEHYASYEHADHGNDYGQSPVMGRAMWAAFVRLVGKVGGEED